MTTRLFAPRHLARCILLLLSLSLASVAFAQKRVAFVIGNNQYEGASQLTNPVNDATLLGNVLQQDLGFEVIRRTNVDRRGLNNLVLDIRDKSKGADVVIVYYSGHGVQGPGGNYLVPVDASIGTYDHIEGEALPAMNIVKALEGTNARVALLILDACRDYAYGNKSIASKGLMRMENLGNNMLVAYATQEGSTATEGRGGNSPYARALAEQLRRTSVPLLEGLDDVAESVRHETGNRQRPTRSGDLRVRTCLIDGKCDGSSAATTVAAARPPPRDVAAEDRALWAQIRDRSEPYLFLQYQLRFPNGDFLEAARRKSGPVAKSRSGCGLREYSLPADIDMEWSGDCRDGLADGRGVKRYTRAGVKLVEWSGALQRGIPTGNWEGVFSSGGTNGRKSMTISFNAAGDVNRVQAFAMNNGVRYEGETDATLASQLGQPDGIGTMWFADGGRYEGAWVKNQRTGQGTLFYPPSTSPEAPLKYTGEFKDGAPSGQGTMVRVSGASYTGGWVNGRRSGRGRLVFTDGGIFEGDFVDDRRNGQGVLTFPRKPAPDSMATYSGSFKDDMFHGQGTMTLANGGTYVGTWANGKRDGKGRLVMPDGYTYDGDWVADKRSGNGVLTPSKNNTPGALTSYTGEFRDDLATGRGTLTYGNGASYRGEVVNMRAHGIGEVRRPDGTTASGRFDQSRNVSEGPIR